MKLQLTRFGSTPFGTFGKLSIYGISGFKLFTVEQMWNNNLPGESCVPLGSYHLVWQPTTTSVPTSYHDKSWYLSGGSVTHEQTLSPGITRTRCCLHGANTIQELRGCIAPGRSLGVVGMQWAVIRSQQALADLLNAIGPYDHELVITNAPCG